MSKADYSRREFLQRSAVLPLSAALFYLSPNLWSLGRDCMPRVTPRVAQAPDFRPG